MAKIIVIANKLTHHVETFIQTVRANHEVTVLTSKDEAFSGSFAHTQDVELLAYFQKWSLAEAIKITPHLLHLAPQIWHFLDPQDSYSNEIRPAMLYLSLLGTSNPWASVAISTYSMKHRPRWNQKFRLMLQAANLITCSSREQLVMTRGLPAIAKKQIRTILPAFSQSYGSLISANPIQIQNPYLVVPIDLVSFLDKKYNSQIIEAFAEHKKSTNSKLELVFAGSWDVYPLRVRKQHQKLMAELGIASSYRMTGSLTAEEFESVLSKSLGILLAGQRLSSIEFSQYHAHSAFHEVPLIFDSLQSERSPYYVEHERNAWVLNSHNFYQDFLRLLQQPDLKLKMSFNKEKSLERLLDAPANELNRIYQRLIQQTQTNVSS